MFEGMGIQWASTVLGCVAAALVPIPVIFYLYGHKIRAKSKFAPMFGAPGDGDQENPLAADENGNAVLPSTGGPEKDAHDAAAQGCVPRTKANAAETAV